MENYTGPTNECNAGGIGGSGCHPRSCCPGNIDLCGRTYQPTRVLAISHLLGRFVANGFKVAVRRDDWMKRRGSASALAQPDGTGQRSSLARMASADFVQRKGLG